jgi:AraC-like DNA-binding protein
VLDREIEIASRAVADFGVPAVGDEADITGTIVLLLMEMLPYGKITIVPVATKLNMSVRTLQRRLRDRGLSFQDLVDVIRRSVAIHHVLAGESSATEIALLLGYSDQAHFTRAFKRWTGVTPRQYTTFCPC